jgi:regulator of sirC expression with transglutaminase-like and TPR domain
LIGGDEGVDLVLINLEIARDVYPDLDFDQVLARIELLAGRVRDRCPPGGGPRSIIGQINWVLFVEEGFRGNVDDYFNAQNSYLSDVIDRKLGLPITLSILYARVASRAGLELGFANLPMHFALRVLESEAPLFVDPFHEGRLLDLPTCERFLSDLAGRQIRLDEGELKSCAASVTVARMLRNLRGVYLNQQDFGSALLVARRLAALRPDDPLELRDWGMVCLQVDRPGEALEPLQKYIDARPEAADADAIRSLLKSARREVAFRN